MSRDPTGGSPDHIIGRWVRYNPVPAGSKFFIFRRIERIAAAYPFCDLTVTVSIHDDWAPALGRLWVPGVLVDLNIEPADHWTNGAEIESLAVFKPKLEMVGVEAGVDQFNLFGNGVVISDMPCGSG